MAEAREDPSAELLRRWQEHGDRAALEALLIAEVDALKAHLRQSGRRPAPAGISVSDVAQDVVLRVLRLDPAPHFESPTAMRGYLWIAAQRLLLDHLRSRHAVAVSLEAQSPGALDRVLETTGGLGTVDDRDRAAALDVALGLLESEDRRLLELFYFQHLGLEAISRQLGISPAAAKMRLARARMSLAKKLVKWTNFIG